MAKLRKRGAKFARDVVELFEKAPGKTVSPKALNSALGVERTPSKNVWMAKKIGFDIRPNKDGVRVRSYTLVRAPKLADAAKTDLSFAKDTVSVTEFRNHYLSIMEAVGRRKLRRVTVVNRGKPLVDIVPSPTNRAKGRPFAHGFLRGSVTIPEGLDLTKPVFEGEIDAEKGILYRRRK